MRRPAPTRTSPAPELKNYTALAIQHSMSDMM
jgi:hypothetical protein